MRVDIVTIFPDMVSAVLGASLLGRAQKSRRLQVRVHNLRDYTHDKRRTVDDRPYGGGPGMVMRPEPIFECVEAIRRRACAGHRADAGACETLLMSPQGEPFSPALAQELAARRHLTVICGHYEGVDERVRLGLAHRSVSIGDYVLTGGELPALVVVDGLARFIPGVIGHQDAVTEESFADGLLEYPHYTRPLVFRGMAVPDVLRSGDHARIARWRKLQGVTKTMALRPDLIKARTRRPSYE
ncbi:MAG: tRNA (guanosine(37)-N1)-methyltransferase TrmD [Candidatus Omnitrophica bacterium]|nr:tRNA (guanosine(37)-N1)-methyltransferase TrmD [Candidatus Omnitrophota bacterium]